MKVKKLLTIMALLLGVCGGAWADDATATIDFGSTNYGSLVQVAFSDGTNTTGSLVDATLGGANTKAYSSVYSVKGLSTSFTSKNSYNNISVISFYVSTTDKGKTYLSVEVCPNADFSSNVTTVQASAVLNGGGLPANVGNNNQYYQETYSLSTSVSGYVRITVSEASGSSGKTINVGNIAITYTVTSSAYTVTFNAGTNGTCGTTSLTEASAGAGVTLPTVTPNANYTFNGWYTAATGGSKVGNAGATYKPTSNITLYAQYSANEAPGISLDKNSVSTPKGKAVTLTATATGSPAPTVTWYQSETATNTGGTEKGTGATYSPDVTTEGTFYYYAVANNGVNPNATSEVVTLAVTNPDKTIEGNNFYIAVDDLAIPEQNIICDDITMQYSIGSYSAATEDETVKDLVSSFKASVNCSTNGWGVTFTPSKAGCLKVGVVINKEKKFSITNVTGFSYQTKNPDGSGTINSNEWTPTEKKYAVITIDVQAGSSYKFSVSGSKMGFYGFEFTPSSEQPATTYTTVYDLAAAMSAATSNFEGNSGTVAATTANNAANAPELAVDATNGKLGKHSDDWAQINSGTILTLPGVPAGAQVSFSLYDATALTIGGVAYTNGQTYTTTANEDVVMTCSTGGYIKSITVVGTPFISAQENGEYTNTWQFGKSNGAPEFALQKSAEYTYEVNGHSLVINTDAGKLNNASRTDKWSQCNDGTLFKVPAYEGAKLSWESYNNGSAVGFNIGGTLYSNYYVATAEETVNMTAVGVGYISFIKIEPVTMYEISGTISGGTVNGASLILTSTGNGQTYTATIESGAFSTKVPAGKYSLDLSDDVAYVISSPSELNISAGGSVGAITIEAVQPQTVTGLIANAPAEAFTLTFTGGSHNKQVELAANATSYETTLDPDTYVISSSVGTLSPLSVESFKVKRTSVTHNIYFPETIPAATSANITVDNTLATVSANNYKTVSDALAAAKAGSISSPVITLTSGQTYREQVIVDMANVTLKTSGEEKATITWYYGIGYTYYSLGTDGYYNKDRAMTRNSINMNDPARWGAAVLVKSTGNGFKAENIVFENSFNQYYTTEEVTDGVRPNGVQSITYDRTLTSGQSGYKAADTKAVTERAAALGFENNPAGCELTNCVLRGSQDTFYTSGKIYVKKSNIIGNTDYIFGGGDVVFDDCDLTIGGYSDQETGAHITASNGGTYIFRDCTVKETNRKYASANLGRDWGGTNANVYFFNLKNEIGDKLSYKWSNMGGAVSAGTANLHIYDFDPTINSNYSTTGADGANVNGLMSDADALALYAGVVTRLDFTPTHIYDGELELGESNVYNICRIAANDNVERDVTLTRSLPANKWATIVLPFALTSDQIASTFGNGTKVAQLTGANETALTFGSVTAMNANEPYMVYSPTGVSETKTISDVTIANGTPAKTTASGVDFIGSYAALTSIPATDGSNTYFFVSNNNLYKTAASGNANTIKGFRAYFKVPGTTAARLTGFVIDDETTGVQESKNSRIEGLKSYYDLKGQRVSQPKKGVYVVGGKKVVVK